MFVTFEGLDGCGKTTQAALLAESLRGEGVDVVSTREPGGTPLGEAIRELVLHGDHVAPWAEAALYVAARPARRPGDPPRARARGDGDLRSLSRHLRCLSGRRPRPRVDTILDLNLLAVGGLVPDRTVLVEIDVETALARVGEKGDRIERAGAEFWPLVVETYRALAARFPERFVVVDGRRSIPEIAQEIRDRLR